MDKDMYRYSAGLVFLEEKHADTGELCNALQPILEARGQRILSVKAEESGHMRVSTDTMLLDLTAPMRPEDDLEIVDDDDPSNVLARAETFIGISLALQIQAPPEKAAAAEQELKSLLAEMTCRLAELTQPGFILWLSASELLETEEFVKAATRIMPRKVRRPAGGAKPRYERPAPLPLTGGAVRAASSDRFPEISIASRSLEHEYERRTRGSADPGSEPDLRSAIIDAVEVPTGDSVPLRLASWVMVTTVGMFFLPMAILLTIANVVRGEDFRLAAHTMALTGLLMVLNASGAMADTLQLIGL